MKIIQLTPSPMAQVPARYARLINKYTSHTCINLQARDFYLGYTSDMPASCPQRIQHEINTADVVHFHGHVLYDRRVWCGIPFTLNPDATIFLEYHGIPQRGRRSFFRQGVKMIVSTPEMLDTFPEALYFPILIDEQEVKRAHPRSTAPPVKLGHLWSWHKQYKDTDVFCHLINQVTERYGKRTAPIFPYIFPEKLTGEQALRAIEAVHVLFDHAQGYYGVASVEAMALEVVAANGATPKIIRHIKNILETDKAPPFVNLDRNDFVRKCMRLGERDFMRQMPHIWKSGRYYVQNYWSGRRMIKKLCRIYEEPSYYYRLLKEQQKIK